MAALEDEAREAFYAGQRVLARLLGVPAESVPACYADFRRYFDAMRSSDVLTVGEQGREIAQAVLHPPGGLGDGGTLRLLTTALLPPRLRDAFSLPWDQVRAQRFDALRASVRQLRAEGGSSSQDRRRVREVR